MTPQSERGGSPWFRNIPGTSHGSKLRSHFPDVAHILVIRLPTSTVETQIKRIASTVQLFPVEVKVLWVIKGGFRERSWKMGAGEQPFGICSCLEGRGYVMSEQLGRQTCDMLSALQHGVLISQQPNRSNTWALNGFHCDRVWCETHAAS